ncbi:hypothetical protein BT63DRAFT_451660 [Microthyrium microscopicum]|uniref:Uncharacterized protein n=1 Tax=Microthyrium microscopicum TaxID=703497 RepID=A0A6A6URQ7_9PEZI|nr:hypothetical protein BT63DRAFT_451660 [Microthyrium microscopicum]
MAHDPEQTLKLPRRPLSKLPRPFNIDISPPWQSPRAPYSSELTGWHSQTANLKSLSTLDNCLTSTLPPTGANSPDSDRNRKIRGNKHMSSGKGRGFLQRPVDVILLIIVLGVVTSLGQKNCLVLCIIRPSVDGSSAPDHGLRRLPWNAAKNGLRLENLAYRDSAGYLFAVEDGAIRDLEGAIRGNGNMLMSLDTREDAPDADPITTFKLSSAISRWTSLLPHSLVVANLATNLLISKGP